MIFTIFYCPINRYILLTLKKKDRYLKTMQKQSKMVSWSSKKSKTVMALKEKIIYKTL